MPNFVPSKKFELFRNVRNYNFIIVSYTLNPINGGFSMSKEPVFHEKYEIARRECNRLAKVHPGKYFVIMQAKGLEYVEANPSKISI